jgi:hypothetical protein
MLVDLLGKSPDWMPVQHCTYVNDLRILDVEQPLAYCLPGVRSRVVVSEGTLKTLSPTEVTAILRHERAHLRARHDLVLEMFTAVHAAFPRFVRSASALDAVRLLIELLADDAAVRAAGPTLACVLRAGRSRTGPGSVHRLRCAVSRSRQQHRPGDSASLGRRGNVVPRSRGSAAQELHRLFVIRRKT